MAKKILLADDSVTIQKVVELTFVEGDYEVVCVSNGKAAIDSIKEERPDILLCDVIMPEMNGYEVASFVKKDPQFSSIPVLLLTGTFEPFDEDKATASGAESYIIKPFDSKMLVDKVEELLTNRVVFTPPEKEEAVQVFQNREEFTLQPTGEEEVSTQEALDAADTEPFVSADSDYAMPLEPETAVPVEGAEEPVGKAEPFLEEGAGAADTHPDEIVLEAGDISGEELQPAGGFAPSTPEGEAQAPPLEEVGGEGIPAAGEAVGAGEEVPTGGEEPGGPWASTGDQGEDVVDLGPTGEEGVVPDEAFQEVVEPFSAVGTDEVVIDAGDGTEHVEMKEEVPEVPQAENPEEEQAPGESALQEGGEEEEAPAIIHGMAEQQEMVIEAHETMEAGAPGEPEEHAEPVEPMEASHGEVKVETAPLAGDEGVEQPAAEVADAEPFIPDAAESPFMAAEEEEPVVPVAEAEEKPVPPIEPPMQPVVEPPVEAAELEASAMEGADVSAELPAEVPAGVSPEALESEVRAALEEMVPDMVRRALEEALPSALQKAIDENLPPAVERLAREVVAKAAEENVPAMVQKLVSETVPAAVEEKAGEAVALKAKEAIEGVLPDTVREAVEKAQAEQAPVEAALSPEKIKEALQSVGPEMIAAQLKELAPEVITPVAWEVIPELAESIIKKRIQELESGIE